MITWFVFLFSPLGHKNPIQFLQTRKKMSQKVERKVDEKLVPMLRSYSLQALISLQFVSLLEKFTNASKGKTQQEP